LRSDLLTEAVRYYQEFVNLSAGDDSLLPELAKVARHMGQINGLLGKWADAIQAHRQAVAFRERLAKADPEAAKRQHDLAIALSELAIAEFAVGKVQEALQNLVRAQAIWEVQVGQHPNDPHLRQYLAKNRNHSGEYLAALGDSARAEQYQQQALALWEQLAKEDPEQPWYRHDLARVCHELGRLSQDGGRTTQALQFYERARAIWEGQRTTAPGVGFGTELAECYLSIGAIEAARGRAAAALRLYENARAELEPRVRDTGEMPHFQVYLAAVYHKIGELNQSLGKPAAALASLHQACTFQENVLKLAPDSCDAQFKYGVILHALALVEWKQGKVQTARATLRRAVTQGRAAMANALQVPQYRKALSDHYRELARLERELGCPAEAVAKVLEWKELRPGDAAELYHAARALALCVPLVAKGKAVTPTEQTERERLIKLAIETLRQAVREGFDDLKQLDSEADLAPLRGTPEFERLRRSMGKPG
jgi:tetratricopeptide (TPR) repeat protein